ncbi:MAG: hypothetical protein Q8S42_04640, partial [Archangium sp.]|nr:hypothetical protein [Archangium sp.]
MSATMRRLLGVVLAMLTLGAAVAIFSSQRATHLATARSQAQAEVDAELPKVAASLDGLLQDLSKTAERGANLEPVGRMLPQITSQSDLAELGRTLADFEVEPFFQPYLQMGAHAFFIGSTPLQNVDPALLPMLRELAGKATTSGRATGLLAEGGR